MTRELSSLVTTLNSSHFWSNGIQIILSALVRITSLCQKSLLKYHKLWSSKPNSVFITIYVLRVSTFDFLLYLSLTQHLIGKQTNKQTQKVSLCTTYYQIFTSLSQTSKWKRIHPRKSFYSFSPRITSSHFVLVMPSNINQIWLI